MRVWHNPVWLLLFRPIIISKNCKCTSRASTAGQNSLLNLYAGVWLHNACLILCSVFLLWWFWTHSALWFRHHRAWASTTQLFSVWYLPVLLTKPLWSALLSSTAGLVNTFSSPMPPIPIRTHSLYLIYSLFLISLLSSLTFLGQKQVKAVMLQS